MREGKIGRERKRSEKEERMEKETVLETIVTVYRPVPSSAL